MSSPAAAIPSPGCSMATVNAGTLINKTIQWTEPGLPAVNRSVFIYVPKAPKRPMPLVLTFHGWGEAAMNYHEKYSFGPLADIAGFMAVYPQGLSEGVMASWNSGDTTVEDVPGRQRVCSKEKVEALRGKDALCYDSCRIKKGRCDPCSWTTCYDDVEFIRLLLEELERSYCIDLSRIFAWGCSNGGMFAHHLARRLPQKFAAIAAACGAKPHEGYESNFSSGGRPVSMLLMQGLDDHTIPRHPPSVKTPWWDGYIFASETHVLDAYKSYDQCTNQASRPLPLPPHVTSQALSCTEHGYDCSGGSRVVGCQFEGGHDLVLGRGANEILDGPEFAWYFFCQLSQSDGCTLPQSLAQKPTDLTLPLMLGVAGIGLALNVLLLWASQGTRSRARPPETLEMSQLTKPRDSAEP